MLEGLLYLHEQGVIHRDIKGSNILATKEGTIKLADFGVATRVGGLDKSVVGSPYWMAPEVVEQSGATTASDVWSVGCTVIELLEGQPPYHQLDPMPALFRIVNDDCPPFPDSASPVVRDFLLQCFQKDSNLRISARKLLKHPWMVSARRQLDQTKRRSNVSRTYVTAYDETIARVQEWNKAIDNKLKPDAKPLLAAKPVSRLSQDVASALQAHNRPGSRITKASQHSWEDTKLEMNIGQVKAGTAGRRNTALKLVSPEEVDADKENDTWDDDFTEGIPKARLTSLEHVTRLEELTEDFSDNTVTLRPGAHGISNSNVPKAVLQNVPEDYSDLVSEESKSPFEGRVADLMVTAVLCVLNMVAHLRYRSSRQKGKNNYYIRGICWRAIQGIFGGPQFVLHNSLPGLLVYQRACLSSASPSPIFQVMRIIRMSLTRRVR